MYHSDWINEMFMSSYKQVQNQDNIGEEKQGDCICKDVNDLAQKEQQKLKR